MNQPTSRLPATGWPLSRLLYLVIAFVAIGYMPLAVNYMWHYFDATLPAWQNDLTARAVNTAYATGSGSVPGVRDVDYAHSRVVMLLHTTVGGLALALAMFQFVAPLRTRYPALHRWSGRVYMTLMTISMGYAITFLVRNSSVNHWGGDAFDLQLWALALGTLFSGFYAIWAIHQRNVVKHQAWMGMNIALMMTAPLLRVFWILIGPLWYQGDLLTNLGAGAMSLAIVAPGAAAIAFMLTRHQGKRTQMERHAPKISLMLAIAALSSALTVLRYQHMQATDFPYDLLGVIFVPMVGYALICLAGHQRARGRGDLMAAWQWQMLFAGAALIPVFLNAGWWIAALMLPGENAFLASAMIVVGLAIMIPFAIVVDLSSTPARAAAPVRANARVM